MGVVKVERLHRKEYRGREKYWQRLVWGQPPTKGNYAAGLRQEIYEDQEFVFDRT